MPVSGESGRQPPLRLSLHWIRWSRREVLVALACTAAIFLLRLPSLFEPPWHSDEGIFAAVATRVINGGQLYADAWESKPPLFLYLYVIVFKLFGAGVLQLHLAATASAIATQWALFGVACKLMSRRRALLASLIAGALLGVPFWEGTLALTEIFTVLPTALAVLCVFQAVEPRVGPSGSRRRDLSQREAIWLISAGALFGIAFLLRQTSAVVLVCVALWLLLSLPQWFKAGVLLAIGFLVAVVPAVLAFVAAGTFDWFWDANIAFFFAYVPSGEEIPFHYRPLIVMPIVVALASLAWFRRRGETPLWVLPALWFVFTLGGALLTGRPYSHYFLQVMPPLALLIAMILPAGLSWRPRFAQAPAFALGLSVLALWLAVVRPEFNGNLIAMHYTKGTPYYANFAGWLTGARSSAEYNDYFDRRVALTLELEEALNRMGAAHKKVYIWGEYPWVYALTGSEPATRYVTSFYVLLIPNLDTKLYETLTDADPRFIVTLTDVWPRLNDESGVARRRLDISTRAMSLLVTRHYAPVASIGRAQIFSRSFNSPLPDDQQDFDESAFVH